MKKFAAILMALIMILSVSAFAEEGNYLTWATEATFAPYEFYGEGDEVIGIDAEIADAIAKKLGYDGAKVEDMGFDSTEKFEQNLTRLIEKNSKSHK